MLIYLDNASTSYPKPNIVAESLSYSMLNFAAPAKGSFSISNNSYDAIIETRDNLADYFNIKDSSSLIFTPGASYAVYFYLNSLKLSKGDVIVYSSLEHNSVYSTLHNLKEKFDVELIQLTYLKHKGFDIEQLENILKSRKVHHIVLTHASNVTGEILPVRKVLELKNNYDFKLFVDASQTTGVFPIDLRMLNIDAMAFSCHKNLLGIPGVGALYVADKTQFYPEFDFYSLSSTQGSSKIDSVEFVTNNLPGIWALNTSLSYLKSVGLENIYQHKRDLTHLAVESLHKISEVVCYSSANNNVGIVSFNISGKKPLDVANILDKKYNICVSSGQQDSLLAYQAIDTGVEGCVRLSFSYFNTREELKIFLRAIKEISESI